MGVIGLMVIYYKMLMEIIIEIVMEIIIQSVIIKINNILVNKNKNKYIRCLDIFIIKD